MMLLLLKHPYVKDVQYNELGNFVSAVFSCSDMQEIDHLDNPYGDEV